MRLAIASGQCNCFYSRGSVYGFDCHLAFDFPDLFAGLVKAGAGSISASQVLPPQQEFLIFVIESFER